MIDLSDVKKSYDLLWCYNNQNEFLDKLSVDFGIPHYDSWIVYTLYDHTNREYIGSTKSIYHRFYRPLIGHFTNIDQGNHSFLTLDNLSEFKLGILEYLLHESISESELRNLEQKYIDKYQSFRFGYNKCKYSIGGMDTTSNTISIYNPDLKLERKVSSDELDQYLNDGYVIGREPNKYGSWDHIRGRIQVYNPITLVNKVIRPEELSEYESLGFIRGSHKSHSDLVGKATLGKVLMYDSNTDTEFYCDPTEVSNYLSEGISKGSRPNSRGGFNSGKFFVYSISLKDRFLVTYEMLLELMNEHPDADFHYGCPSWKIDWINSSKYIDKPQVNIDEVIDIINKYS